MDQNLWNYFFTKAVCFSYASPCLVLYILLVLLSCSRVHSFQECSKENVSSADASYHKKYKCSFESFFSKAVTLLKFVFTPEDIICFCSMCYANVCFSKRMEKSTCMYSYTNISYCNWNITSWFTLAITKTQMINSTKRNNRFLCPNFVNDYSLTLTSFLQIFVPLVNNGEYCYQSYMCVCYYAWVCYVGQLNSP